MIEWALKHLSKKADEAEIFYLESTISEIRTKRFSAELFTERKSTGYGIRAIKNKKMGFYYTNKLSEEALENSIKLALSAEQDPHIGLPGRQTYKNGSSKTFELGIEEALELAKDMVEPAREYKEVRPTSGVISWGTSTVVVGNTNGVFGEKSESSISAYLSTVAKAAEPATGFDYLISREKDISTSEVGINACTLAKNSLHPVKMERAKGRVIMRPMAVTELFESTLLPSFSADNVQRGRSKLAGMIGEQIFSGLDITDDATIKEGFMSESFDDEGVSTGRTDLVKSGILEGFLYDTYTANKDRVKSTGNAGRSSHSSLPGVGASNFIISGDEWIENEDNALIINGIVGAHTANPVSGDFSCETRNAFWNGRPIRKVIISGNIFEMMGAVVKFGNDHKQYSSVISPSIEFSEITMAG